MSNQPNNNNGTTFVQDLQQSTQSEQNYSDHDPFEDQDKMTNILVAYKEYWKNYVNFEDRTSRAGFWWVVLINTILTNVLYTVLDSPFSLLNAKVLFNSDMATTPFILFNSLSLGLGIFLFIWMAANIIPMIAIVVRRLHDIGKSWPNILFNLIPLVGQIITIVFMATRTQYPPYNRFYNATKRG